MSQKTGTFDIQSLLAANNQSAASYGTDQIAEILAMDNLLYSEQVTGALADLCETSQDRQRLAGSSISGDMQEVDEYAQGPTQKDLPGYLVGFPLKKFQFAVGWTKQFERNATPADYAVKQQAAQAADLRRTRYELQKAIYNPTNFTFKDLNVDTIGLPVKAFINADSSPMANGPNGEVFSGASHTHFVGAASLTALVVQTAINNVAEHRTGVDLRIFINQADAGSFQALTGFVPLQVPYVTINTAANQVAAPRLDIGRLDNRQIGWFGAAQVWTKPWAVQNYFIVADVAAPMKPLVRRVEKNDRGLFVAAEIDAHPLRSQYVERFQGFGAWGRTALAVVQFNNASYSAPTLTF